MRKSIQMNGEFALDTSIVIKIFAQENEVLKKVEQCQEIYIPPTVIGELYYGAYNSTKVKENVKRVDELIETTPILASNIMTATQYGLIKKDLKTQGTPIPENDIWIAAIAIQFNLTLAGRDDHFENIERLNYEKR